MGSSDNHNDTLRFRALPLARHVALFHPCHDSEGRAWHYPGFADEDTEVERSVTCPQTQPICCRIRMESSVCLMGVCIFVICNILLAQRGIFQTASHNALMSCEIGLVGRAGHMISGAQCNMKTQGPLFKSTE